MLSPIDENDALWSISKAKVTKLVDKNVRSTELHFESQLFRGKILTKYAVPEAAPLPSY